MPVSLPTILWAVSALCFALGSAGVPTAVNTVSVGLFFLVLGLLFGGLR